jgi:pyruvate/2-oxoglutarate dehydrogenase complex dihydrolipoamide acyltransferase (E2) component
VQASPVLCGIGAGIQTQPTILAFAVEQAGSDLPNPGTCRSIRSRRSRRSSSRSPYSRSDRAATPATAPAKDILERAGLTGGPLARRAAAARGRAAGRRSTASALERGPRRAASSPRARRPARELGVALPEQRPHETLDGLGERRVRDVALVPIELARCEEAAGSTSAGAARGRPTTCRCRNSPRRARAPASRSGRRGRRRRAASRLRAWARRASRESAHHRGRRGRGLRHTTTKIV